MCVVPRSEHSCLGGCVVSGGGRAGGGELYLTNGILLLHDMHALASVHILLQNPQLLGASPLQDHTH